LSTAALALIGRNVARGAWWSDGGIGQVCLSTRNCPAGSLTKRSYDCCYCVQQNLCSSCLLQTTTRLPQHDRVKVCPTSVCSVTTTCERMCMSFGAQQHQSVANSLQLSLPVAAGMPPYGWLCGWAGLQGVCMVVSVGRQQSGHTPNGRSTPRPRPVWSVLQPLTRCEGYPIAWVGAPGSFFL
jgi:hypothetical protein